VSDSFKRPRAHRARMDGMITPDIDAAARFLAASGRVL
jgi:hypothetical protein